MVHTNSKSRRKSVFQHYNGLEKVIAEFNTWNRNVKQWLEWIETHIPANLAISRREALDYFHVTPLGLKVLERIKVDIYPDGHTRNRNRPARTVYDAKKVLRAVVALPTIARLRGLRTTRRSDNITTVLKEIIDNTINGTAEME